MGQVGPTDFSPRPSLYRGRLFAYEIDRDVMAKLKCFLSYRRQDTIVVGTVGRIYDRLIAHYGDEHAFMDVDDIPPGSDFRHVLSDAVGQADVLLAVIGTQWAEIMRSRGDDAADFVRIEIESALQRGIPVVPVLIGGADMPQPGDLPESIRELVYRNAVIVDPSRDFHAHVTRLIADLDRHYAAAPQGKATIPSPPEPTPPPVAPPSSSPLENSLGMRFVPVPGLEDVHFSIWQTRVQDYAAFAAENPGIDRSWQNVEYEGHQQEPDHPVINVSWEDATAFCEWLSRKEGQVYRLPTDHEWSVAVGIGDRENPNALPEEKSRKLGNLYPWGTEWPPPSGSGNFGGEECEAFGWTTIKGYRDDYPFTAPVGSFPLEHHGIKDLSGNVWEWCQDWYENDHQYRVLRGGSWRNDYGDYLQSSARINYAPSYRYFDLGFRCVLVVGVAG